ncbi:MAG: glycosyltransferase [Pseudonocardiaceae bacterium]
MADGRMDVVIAVHNGAATIEACVRSVLDIAVLARVLVADDGSTDSTPDILSRIEDDRLQVERVEHRSRARAANHVLRMCTAPFVCSVDADVRVVEDRFDELLELAVSVPFLMLSDEGHGREVTPVRLTEKEFRAPRNAFLFSRRALPGLRFADIYPAAGGEDTDLAFRLLKAGVGVGVTAGGYEHARDVGPMGWRRRAHFHAWNLVTYARHLDVPLVRERLGDIARHPLRRVSASVRQELGASGHRRTVR